GCLYIAATVHAGGLTDRLSQLGASEVLEIDHDLGLIDPSHIRRRAHIKRTRNRAGHFTQLGTDIDRAIVDSADQTLHDVLARTLQELDVDAVWTLPLRNHVRDPRERVAQRADHVLHTVDQTLNDVLTGVEQQRPEITDVIEYVPRDIADVREEVADVPGSRGHHVGEEVTDHPGHFPDLREEVQDVLDTAVDQLNSAVDPALEELDNRLPDARNQVHKPVPGVREELDDRFPHACDEADNPVHARLEALGDRLPQACDQFDQPLPSVCEQLLDPVPGFS